MYYLIMFYFPSVLEFISASSEIGVFFYSWDTRIIGNYKFLLILKKNFKDQLQNQSKTIYKVPGYLL